MKNIEVVGNLFVQGSYTLLRNSYDRVKASIFFADECSKNSETNNLDLANWYSRACLSEYKSIFDVLNSDFRNIGADKIWKRNKFRNQLEDNVLIKILKKTRDLATHTAILPSSHRASKYSYIEEQGERIVERQFLFFNEIDKSMLSYDSSKISTEELAWFNKQSSTWPIHLLVREAIFQSSVPISNFITGNITKFNVQPAVSVDRKIRVN